MLLNRGRSGHRGYTSPLVCLCGLRFGKRVGIDNRITALDHVTGESTFCVNSSLLQTGRLKARHQNIHPFAYFEAYYTRSTELHWGRNSSHEEVLGNYYVDAGSRICGFGAHALKDPMVGGTEMHPTKNIVEKRHELQESHHAGSRSQNCRTSGNPGRYRPAHRIWTDQ